MCIRDRQFSVNDLDAVLVSEGPGSYTGLRIAASGVKGLLFGSEVKLYGVQTLASFAKAALEKSPQATNIHAIIDARRKHVYHQKFKVKNAKLTAIKEVQIMAIELFEKGVQADDVIIGTGLSRLDQGLIKKIKCLGKEFISAGSLVTLFHSDGADPFVHKVAPAAFDPKYYTSNQV